MLWPVRALPVGPGLGKQARPGASRESGDGFSSAPSGAWESGPSRWEDRGPALAALPRRGTVLRAAHRPGFQKPALAPQTAGREDSQTPYPWEAAGKPWPFPEERERREDRRCAGGGGLELTVPTGAACEVGLSPTFLVGHPGTARGAGSTHFRPQEGHRWSACVLSRRWAFVGSCDRHPASPKPCVWPAWSQAALGSCPAPDLSSESPAALCRPPKGRGQRGRGDALMGTPRSPLPLLEAAPPRCLGPGEAVPSCFPKTSS